MASKSVSRKNKGVASAVEQRTTRIRAKINGDYAARHPERAKAERALRKAHAQAAADFGRKREGTTLTHAKAQRVRQGALARLCQSGAISAEQLGAALEIAEVIARIGADLSIKGMSIETRIDQSRNPDAVFFEALSQVRREMAYTRWRAKLAWAGHVQPVLAMIVQDMSLTAAASLYPIGAHRLKRVLRAALDDWGACLDHVYKTVSHGDMVAAQAGLL